MSASPTPMSFSETSMEKAFIAISGLIGAGKSTLARELGRVLELPVFYEPVIDNTYLADFYEDMHKYAFSMQIYLLNRRFKQQQQIVWAGTGGVQDRTIYEDAVFARMLCDSGIMDKRDHDTYVTLFKHMSNFMCKPNVIVHLDVSPEESLRRIRLRNRDCEKTVSLEYLTALSAAYEAFLKDISRVIPVIRVDWSKFQSTEDMARRVSEQYKRIHNIRHVTFFVAAGFAHGEGREGGRAVRCVRRPRLLHPVRDAGLHGGRRRRRRLARGRVRVGGRPAPRPCTHCTAPADPPPRRSPAPHLRRGRAYFAATRAGRPCAAGSARMSAPRGQAGSGALVGGGGGGAGGGGAARAPPTTLPRTVVARVCQEAMPPGFMVPAETQTLMSRCCEEFAHILAAEAAEVCEASKRKTMTAEHILQALDRLEMSGYSARVRELLAEQGGAAASKRK